MCTGNDDIKLFDVVKGKARKNGVRYKNEYYSRNRERRIVAVDCKYGSRTA